MQAERAARPAKRETARLAHEAELAEQALRAVELAAQAEREATEAAAAEQAEHEAAVLAAQKAAHDQRYAARRTAKKEWRKG